MGKEQQKLVLAAFGIKAEDTDFEPLVTWHVFVHINCLFRFNSMKKSEQINYICKLFSPGEDELVQHDTFDNILNTIFGG